MSSASAVNPDALGFRAVCDYRGPHDVGVLADEVYLKFGFRCDYVLSHHLDPRQAWDGVLYAYDFVGIVYDFYVCERFVAFFQVVPFNERSPLSAGERSVCFLVHEVGELYYFYSMFEEGAVRVACNCVESVSVPWGFGTDSFPRVLFGG